MVKLPTEQDIGDLPDRLPRRMGVGSWQPGDLARGAQQFSRGLEQLSTDLSGIAAQGRRTQNESDVAAAQSAAAVSHIRTSQAITNSNDPTAVLSMRENYGQNVEDAASLIKDPEEQKRFRLAEAPKVAQYEVGADNHATGLVKNKAIADFDTNATTSINAAVSTDDEGQRAAALNAVKANGQALVSRGLMTPEEWAVKARETAHNYAAARVESEITRAKATGDTSRLQDLSKLFTFNPGEWGAAAPAGGGSATQRIAAYQPQIESAASKYGVSPTYLQKTAYIESAGKPDADNGFARGFMQFSDATAKAYGVNQKDAASSIDGAAHYAADNRPVLAKALGREPTDAELYIAHQQGPGAAALFANPNTPAGQLVGRAAIKNNGGNPDAPAKQFTDMWIRKYNEAPVPGGAGEPMRLPGAAGGGAPALAVGDSLARGVGGVTGKMNAATGATPEQVLDLIRGQPVTTTHKEGGKTVTETAPGLTDADLKGGPIVLSSGVSNSVGDVDLVGAQLAGLRQRGVDMSKVTLLGVGTRDDFKAAKVNDALQAAAQKYGAKFQPLDAGMVGPDGVHLVPAGYKAIAGQTGGATAQPAAFAGLPPDGAEGPNPHLVPPKAQWPDGASGIEHNDDGSLSYIMDDGRRVGVPGSRASGASGAPAPGGTGTILDALKPYERAELGLKLQNEIDSIERGKQAADNQYAKAAVADLTARVQSMTDGRPIGPNEEASLKPYAESPNPAVRKAYAETMAIRDNLASYQGKSPAQVQADVIAKEAAYNRLREAYPNSPAIERAGLILNAAEKYSKTYATEAARQPIERAAKAGLLPSGAPAVDPADPNVGTALARRVSDAHTAADALGVSVRYFQESERPALKAVARQGGDAMVNFAKNIVESAGADAPAMFKEIGLDAPMFQKIGELAAGGGDPEAVRDIAAVIGAKTDKAARGDLPTFADKMLAKFEDPFPQAAARFGPDFTGRTRAAANMLMTAQAQRDGWDPKTDPNNANLNQQFVDRAYHLAAGGTYAADGTKYGGIADRNSANWTGPANKLMVPNTIKTDDFGKVINSLLPSDLAALPNPPVSRSGVPIPPKQIQGGTLEAVPDNDGIFRGKYVVFSGERNDENLVRDGKGKAWVLDLAQPKLDAALRARNPNSFLGGTKPATPEPNRYRATPGVIASGGEGGGLSGAAEIE